MSSRFLYPSLITFLTLTITFPLGTGKYIAGELNVHDQVSANDDNNNNKDRVPTTILTKCIHLNCSL